MKIFLYVNKELINSSSARVDLMSIEHMRWWCTWIGVLEVNGPIYNDQKFEQLSLIMQA